MFEDENNLEYKSNYNFNAPNECNYFADILITKYGSKFVGRSLTKASEKNTEEIINIIADKTDSEIVDIKSIDSNSVVVYRKKNFHIFIVSFESYAMQESMKIKHFHIVIYTHYNFIKELSDSINKIDFLESENAIPFISWVIKTQGGLNFQNFSISENKIIKDCYYPCLKNTVNDFYEKYESSDSPILIILGPPGTGKTSFIRNYIYKHNKKCMVSYDNKLLTSDDFFLFFLQSEHNLLLLEDHDTFLQDREDTVSTLENSIMNKFLSLSEGIIDISNKKIIFTANIDKDRIDPALIRPGRCYDVLEFRPYTMVEAAQVVKDAELPSDQIYNGITIAELFHNKTQYKKKKKLGF